MHVLLILGSLEYPAGHDQICIEFNTKTSWIWEGNFHDKPCLY